MISRVIITALLTIVVGCGVETLEEASCPTEGTTLSYESFGQSFLGAHCQSCHGGLGPDRQGAPAGYDFGTAESARAWKARIYARSAASNTTMPPGPDDPPEDERARLAEWLACGAP